MPFKSPEDWLDRIRHILEAIHEIEGFVADQSFEDFLADPRTIRAVTADFAIIGEAARNIREEIENQYKQVPWRIMRDMRNVLVHVYFAVDPRILWDTIRTDLPPLRAELQRIINEHAGG